MRIKWNVPGLLAYGLSAFFTIAGMLALAGGNAQVVVFDRSIHVRGFDSPIGQPVDVVGDERHLFGALLLAMGYLMLRWVFRRSSGPRNVSVEIQIAALFVIAGYLAYRVGG